MSILSLQLLLYGLTWLALGSVFKVRRVVGNWWAGAFVSLSVGTLSMSGAVWLPEPGSTLLVNTALVGGFYGLMRGMAVMAAHPLSRWDQALPLACLLAVVVARFAAPDAVSFRLALFFVGAASCVARAGLLLRGLLTRVGFRRLFVPLGLMPVLAILGLLLLRPVAVVLGKATPAAALLETHSTYQDVLVVASFVSLALFNVAMVVVVVGELVSDLRRRSNTDALTRLPNRRAILSSLGKAFQAYRRAGSPFSVVVIDIDHFKRVNDTWGHAAGDQVLVSVATTMNQTLRASDSLARFGGEEFLVHLPHTTEDEAVALAERMRRAVAHPPMGKAAPLDVTISLGVSVVYPDDATLDEVIARADKALYAAKHQGRNRVARACTETETLWEASWASQTGQPGRDAPTVNPVSAPAPPPARPQTVRPRQNPSAA